MTSPIHSNRFLVSVLLVSTWFLFWGDTGVAPARSVQDFWDIGHIFYFALVAFLLLKTKWIARQSLAMQWLVILSITLITGTLIEVAQYGTDRSPDTGDILRDITGSLLVLAFTASSRQAGAIPWGLLWKSTAVIILLIQLKPLLVSLIDETIARNQFPILANFETPFEVERWSGNAQRFQESPAGLHAEGFMKLNLTARKYSGTFLKYFPGDWRGFHALRLKLYNPDTEAVSVTCRIHDYQHAIGEQQYMDRFNQSYLLTPGFNDIKIELEAVAAAPKGREMDLSRIHRLGIFISAHAKPRTLYVQEVRLE